MHATCPVALAQNIGLDGMPHGIVALVSGDSFSALIPEDDFAVPVEDHDSSAENLECDSEDFRVLWPRDVWRMSHGKRHSFLGDGQPGLRMRRGD